MNRRWCLLFCVLALACRTEEWQPATTSGSLPPAKVAVDPFAAPAGAQQLCAGHVAGAPQPGGAPGPHITWTAYSSVERHEALASRYRAAFGRNPDSAEAGCDVWRTPSATPSRVIEVCDVAAKGPWSGCAPMPGSTKSIILISSMAR